MVVSGSMFLEGRIRIAFILFECPVFGKYTWIDNVHASIGVSTATKAMYTRPQVDRPDTRLLQR